MGKKWNEMKLKRSIRRLEPAPRDRKLPVPPGGRRHRPICATGHLNFCVWHRWKPFTSISGKAPNQFWICRQNISTNPNRPELNFTLFQLQGQGRFNISRDRAPPASNFVEKIQIWRRWNWQMSIESWLSTQLSFEKFNFHSIQCSLHSFWIHYFLLDNFGAKLFELTNQIEAQINFC